MRYTSLSATSAALALSVSSASVLAQQASPPAAAPTVNLCEELVRFVERRGTAQPASPVTLDQARGFQRANNVVACRDGWVRVQGAGIALPAAVVAVVQVPPTGQRGPDGANIVVQQPAPTVRVEQAAPQVTVQPAQPQVTVRQAQPEILVRQPAPTVTVDIPQPEIIVRMPQPEVNVAQARPQVTVNQPRPEVEVVQPAQPQVQVTPAQPQILVQRPLNAEANVQVLRPDQQPQVRFERAEPQVTVNQAQGQPTVRVERIGEAPAGQAAPAMTAGAAAGTNGQRMLAVSELEDMDVYNVRGNEIGEVENVLIGPNNQIQLVVAYGGFLGVGERRVTLPLNHVQVQNDRVVVVGPTDDQLKALPAYATPPQGYRDAEDTYRAAVIAFVPVAVGTATVAPAPATTGAVPANPAAPTRAFSVSSLMNREVYNLRGNRVGDIERVLMGEGSKLFVVVGHGGFLELGEKQVLIPMERIQVRDDRLVVEGYTDEQIRAMPEFRFNQARGYRELERTYNADLTLYRG